MISVLVRNFRDPPSNSSFPPAPITRRSCETLQKGNMSLHATQHTLLPAGRLRPHMPSSIPSSRLEPQPTEICSPVPDLWLFYLFPSRENLRTSQQRSGTQQVPHFLGDSGGQPLPGMCGNRKGAFSSAGGENLHPLLETLNAFLPYWTPLSFSVFSVELLGLCNLQKTVFWG